MHSLQKINNPLYSYIFMLLVSTVVVLIAHFGVPYLSKYYLLTGWATHFEYGGYICWGTALVESKGRNHCPHTFEQNLYQRLPTLLSLLGIFFFVASEALSST